MRAASPPSAPCRTAAAQRSARCSTASISFISPESTCAGHASPTAAVIMHKLYPGRRQQALRQITAAVGVAGPRQGDPGEKKETETVENPRLPCAPPVLA